MAAWWDVVRRVKNILSNHRNRYTTDQKFDTTLYHLGLVIQSMILSFSLVKTWHNKNVSRDTDKYPISILFTYFGKIQITMK